VDGTSLVTDCFGVPSFRKLESIWGFRTNDVDDVWMVGGGGTVLRLASSGDDPRFEVVDSGTTRNLRAIWGPDPERLWTAGAAATVLFWNGKEWGPERVPLSPQRTIDALGGAGDDVWAVGEGFALRRGSRGGAPQ